jgi:thiamine-phosphate pyrophosphorylase
MYAMSTTVRDGMRVMFVSDRHRLAAADRLPDVAGAAARAGVDDIQVREKDMSGRALAEIVRSVREAVAGTPARVLVNGRVDVALATGAGGVQLPEVGLPVAAVKRAFPRLVVGASRHSVDGARQAEAEGADFVVLGPVFASPGKEDRAIGLAVLEDAARAVRVPVYAIGGIDAVTARAAVDAGARGLALLRPFLTGSAVETVARLEAALR